MKSFFSSTLLLALIASPALAQQKPDTDQRLKELERKLEILSKELETQKTGSSLSLAGEDGKFGLAPAASKVYSTASGLSIGGYGEFLYQNFEQKLQNGTRDPKPSEADALRLILYTGYKFTDRIIFNSELEWEHGGYSDEHKAGEVKVEFAYFDFLFNKSLNLRAGKVLIPNGFINEIHEPPTFLGTRRPEVEKSILPSTWSEIGIGVHGELPANLSYRAYLSTGLDALGRGEEGATEGFSASGIRGGRQDGKEAFAQSLALSGRLDWNPLPGTLVGVSAFSGNSNQSGNGPKITTNVYDLHAEYRAFGFQFRGLYAQVTNSKPGVEVLAIASAQREVGTKQFGGYLEAGYDVFGGRFQKQALIPFARWERLNTQQQVVSGVGADRANDRTLLTIGVNYKPIPQIAVKADWTKDENRERTGRNQFNLGLGWYF
jgi:hypothetical protein